MNCLVQLFLLSHKTKQLYGSTVIENEKKEVWNNFIWAEIYNKNYFIVKHLLIRCIHRKKENLALKDY